MPTESPQYNVEYKEGKFEIRFYPDYILAHVDVIADFDKALGQGFSILASYIFGDNQEKEKLAMTIPVSQEQLSSSDNNSRSLEAKEEEILSNIHRISFIMPSKYDLKTLPRPNDDRINFKEVKKVRMAVLKFSGRVNSTLASRKINELKAWILEKDFDPKSQFIVAQYNHPAVPGFLRKNEIMIEI